MDEDRERLARQIEKGIAAPVTNPARASVRPASEAAVKTRDIEILKRLTIAPATLRQLVTVMPDEGWPTDEDREAACRSAVIRLTVKKQIKAVEGGGWALA